MDEFHVESDYRTFEDRFKKFQDFLSVKKPYAYPSGSSTFRKPIRTKVTPIIKDNTKSRATRTDKGERNEVELFPSLTPKLRDLLDDILDVIIPSRSDRLSKQRVFEWVEKFVIVHRVVFPKSREKSILGLVYCVVMCCRSEGIILDIHMLSIELDIPFKNIVDAMNERLPPITSNNIEDVKLISLITETPRSSLIYEYSNAMRRVVDEFVTRTTPELRVTEEDVKTYQDNCLAIFEMLEGSQENEYERQFCVTPDKVYVYGIFEIIRSKRKGITERTICDFLSSKFKLPRVTVEKMKRLIMKYRG